MSTTSWCSALRESHGRKDRLDFGDRCSYLSKHLFCGDFASTEVGNFTWGFGMIYGVFDDEPYFYGAGYIDRKIEKGHIPGLKNGVEDYIRYNVPVR